MWPPSVGAVRFLALAGWRLGEALALEWAHVDLDRRTATLPDTKTGRSVRPLSRAACDLLSALPRLGPLVFPASRGGRMTGFRSMLDGASRSSAVSRPTITPHTLRHSFASLAADLGYSRADDRRAHRAQRAVGHVAICPQADAVLLAAADAVASETAKLMGEEPGETSVVPFPGRRAGAAASAGA